MNKKIALALLLSTLHIDNIYVMEGSAQSGAFPSSHSPVNPGLLHQNDQQPPQYDQTQGQRPAGSYGQHTGSYYVGVPYPVPAVVTQPYSQATQTNSHHHTTAVNCNCCVVGNNCCPVNSNGNDECHGSCPQCPVNVSISPWVNAALNLFTCGRSSADKDPSAQQLIDLQNRNRDMRPVTAVLLPTGKPRVVTKEHKE